MTAAFHQRHRQSTEALAAAPSSSSPASPTQAAHATTHRFRHHGFRLGCRTTLGNDADDQHGVPAPPQQQQQQQYHSMSGWQAQTPGEGTKWAQAHVRSAAVPLNDFAMLPPMPSTHASWQALHEYAQSHAAAHGYALSINTTAKDRSRIKLACVCYGQPKNTHKLTAETRVRKKRASYKTGCRMWVEGKKQDNGMWVLRVGEARHNHGGRASEDWAVQRKRTWGVVGGRVGVGGVTAQEEASYGSTVATQPEEESVQQQQQGTEEVKLRPMASHKVERGGLIWRIVEQEMLRKGEPGQGRDRGVGRTVEVLQTRLPGIHIFKRDVYNIRAQIRKSRKAAGQQIGEGLSDSEPDGGGDVDNEDEDEVEDEDKDENVESPTTQAHALSTRTSQPLLPEPTSAPLTPSPHSHGKDSSPPRKEHFLPVSATARCEAYEAEVEQLRQENAELRRLLSEKTDEVKTKSIAIASLRSQADYITMMSMVDERAG